MAEERQYDGMIKAAAETYLPLYDWRLLRSQIRAESNFKSDAVSSVGAEGLCQFMPETWAQIRNEMRQDRGDPFDPRQAIPTMAFYLAKLQGKWNWKRSDMDRFLLAIASYNAGFGNVVAAQKEAGNPVEYGLIIRELHRVTGHHSQETIKYVSKTLKYYFRELGVVF